MTLIRLSRLSDYRLRATDDELGNVKDLLFDDRDWAIRYVVADTRAWLPGRKVLLAPGALGRPDPGQQVLTVDLTREQIRRAPGLEEDEPVSDQHERGLADWFGWTPYWTTAAMGGSTVPVPVEPVRRKRAPAGPAGDAHLRSADEVVGYRLEVSSDGAVGRVEDLLVATDGWRVRYLVGGETGGRLSGRSILVAPDWIERLDRAEEKAFLALDAAAIRESPDFAMDGEVTREYEQRLYEHYRRDPYWV